MKGQVTSVFHRVMPAVFTVAVAGTLAGPAMAANVTIAWNPPTNNVDGSVLTDLSGFKIHYGRTSSYGSQRDVGLVNSCVVTGLQEGVRYFLSVTAYNTGNLHSDYAQALDWVVPDLTAPVLVPPAPVRASAGADGKGRVPDFKASLVVTDNCSVASSIAVVQTPAAGTAIGLGVTEVTLTASDAAGNRAVAGVAVTVADDTAPALAHDTPITITADESGSTILPNLMISVLASDNCTPGADLVLRQAPASGSTIGVGAHTVTLTAADQAGNEAQVQVVVNVLARNKSPIVAAGADQLITLPTKTVTLNGSATDDRLPAGSTLQIAWALVSGPAAVTFTAPGAAVTDVKFTLEGSYVLRLTASDGELSAADEVLVEVRPRPAPQPPTKVRVVGK